MTPPTPALALVTEALREFGIKCASELNVTGTVLRFADEKAEPAARALLQKLDALTGNNDREVCHQEEQKNLAPPDAIRAAEPFTVLPDTAGWDSVNECPTCGYRLAPPSPPAHEHGQGWRAISEAPTNDGASLWVYDAALRTQGRAEYQAGRKLWLCGVEGYWPRPTHWMPLPEPPQ